MKPPTILLIDDCPSLHRLVHATLTSDGFEVHSAFNGASGIQRAKALRPDIILLDVCLPDIDGMEVCELLAAFPETSTIPVIFLSGRSDPSDRARGLNQGATDYIAKPFAPVELSARLRVALRFKWMLHNEATRASRDGLTGLWNRAYFDQRLSAEAETARVQQRPLACLMADLDHFKSLNDTYGHSLGDDAIRSAAAAILSVCRPQDVACRYGGEEFVILCPNTRSAEAAEMAERIRRAVAMIELRAKGDVVRVSVSVGVADQAAGLENAMVQAADSALYQAKHAGRNTVVQWSAVGAALAA